MRDEAEADLPGGSLELVIPQPRQVVGAPEYMSETDYYYYFRKELRSFISDHYKIRRSTPAHCLDSKLVIAMLPQQNVLYSRQPKLQTAFPRVGSIKL